MKRVLVTGASGFIGSRYVCEHLGRMPEVEIIVGVDIREAPYNPPEYYHHAQFDLASPDAVSLLLDEINTKGITTVIHAAAFTSVDGSIHNPHGYGSSNCLSALTVFESVRLSRTNPRLINISTDEVYGPLLFEPVDEFSQYRPTNPYSASKAYGVMLASSYCNTYGVNVSTTFACNTYGERQTFDKLIPRAIRLLSEGSPVPIYGNGNHSRNWMHVDDHCRAISRVAMYGSSGVRYNVECPTRLTNIQVVNMVANMMGIDSSAQEIMKFGVEDRLGHDVAYGMDTSAICAIGWKPQESVFNGMRSTVDWYLRNKSVWKELE